MRPVIRRGTQALPSRYSEGIRTSAFRFDQYAARAPSLPNTIAKLNMAKFTSSNLPAPRLLGCGPGAASPGAGHPKSR